jgi:hypothetical protein
MVMMLHGILMQMVEIMRKQMVVKTFDVPCFSYFFSFASVFFPFCGLCQRFVRTLRAIACNLIHICSATSVLFLLLKAW